MDSNRDELVALTLELMDTCDELGLTELGESIVSEIWKVEYRFPVKSDMDWFDVDEAIKETKDYIEWVETNC